MLPADVRRLAREKYSLILKIAVILLACYGTERLLWWKWRESPFYYYLVQLDDLLTVVMVARVLIEGCARFFKGRK